MQRNPRQTYPDGVLALYAVKPGTPYGQVTEDDLTAVQPCIRYEERKVGLPRYWQSFGAGVRVDHVVRVPLIRGTVIEPGMVARLVGYNGAGDVLCTILQVQLVREAGAQDLSLGVMGVDKG